MKKRMLPLFLLLTLCMTICANAAVLRSNNPFTATPTLSVSGHTATYGIDVVTSDSNAKITVSLSLKVKNSSGGYSTPKTWTSSGTGEVNVSRTYTDNAVSKGNCRLEYTIVISGSGGYDRVTGAVDG